MPTHPTAPMPTGVLAAEGSAGTGGGGLSQCQQPHCQLLAAWEETLAGSSAEGDAEPVSHFSCNKAPLIFMASKCTSAISFATFRRATAVPFPGQNSSAAAANTSGHFIFQNHGL